MRCFSSPSKWYKYTKDEAGNGIDVIHATTVSTAGVKCGPMSSKDRERGIQVLLFYALGSVSVPSPLVYKLFSSM